MNSAKSPLEGLTYFIHAFGCQMNKHDSERVSGMLDSRGCFQVNRIEDSDIVVLLTCCVREAADSRMFGQLESMKNIPLRVGSPLEKRQFVIGGCIAQRDGNSLLEKYDFIDVVIGTQVLSQLTNLLEKSISEGIRGCSTPESSSEFASDLPSKREHSWAAWLPITSGCNNFCTYCIVPYVRGRERSRTPEHILEEVRRRVAEGAVEIQLLGQNVNSYGRGLDESIRFDELLEQVNAVPGVERIRFMTSHPKDLSPELIAAMGRLDKVCPHFHLPLQSGSSRILKAMNRHYDADRYRAIVRQLRDAVPGIAVTTDIIVGFPGETEEDFEETLQMVRDVRFNGAFTFLYSPREGTPAASMPDPVPEAVAKARFERLLKLLEEIQYEDQQKLVGQTLTVLAEEHSKNDPTMLTGRAPGNQLVHFPAGDVRIGQMAEVTITQASAFYLTGRLTGGPM